MTYTIQKENRVRLEQLYYNDVEKDLPLIPPVIFPSQSVNPNVYQEHIYGQSGYNLTNVPKPSIPNVDKRQMDLEYENWSREQMKDII